MSGLPKVTILFTAGGLLANISVLDGIAAMVGTGHTMLGQPKKVFSLADAEEQGFTFEDEPAAYRHIREFYQEAGGNMELHLMLVPASMTMEDMLDDTNENGAKKLINSTNGIVRLLGVFRDPDADYDPGDEFIDADVEAALLKSKTFHQSRLAELVSLRSFIEGRVANPEVLATATYQVTVAGTNGNIATLKVTNGDTVVTLGEYTVQTSDTAALVGAGLRSAIEELSGTHDYTVSGTGANVIIKAPKGTGAAGNDLILTDDDNTGTVDGTITDFAGGSNMLANTLEPKTFSNGFSGVVLGGSLPDGSASIGILLGRLVKYGAHIKAGKVENGALSLTDCYIGNQKIQDVKGLGALHDQGFISFMKQPNKGGFYFGIDNMASTDDYRLIVFGRLVDKASLIASALYIEKLQGEVSLDRNGKIDSLTLAAMRGDIRQAIGLGMGDQISDVQIFINPNQLLVPTNTLELELKIQPLGYTDYINVKLGLTAPSA